MDTTRVIVRQGDEVTFDSGDLVVGTGLSIIPFEEPLQLSPGDAVSVLHGVPALWPLEGPCATPRPPR